jgi:hypothetical protein
MEGRGDLALALRRATAAVQGSALPARAIAVATDAQRTSWVGATRTGVSTAVHAPAGAPPRNRAVIAAAAEPARWTPRGAIHARIDAADSVGYRVLLADRTIARGAAAGDEPVLLRAAPPERGWQAGRVELEPDDFPADDARHFAVWIGAAPAVASDPSAGPFAATALGVLIADGRASAGSVVRITAADAATALPALIVPPSDPVRVGAANRQLARLGIPWRYGAIDRGSVMVRGDRLEGVGAGERYRLFREGAEDGDTLATAGGSPWIVAGPGYVLIASRLDPAATSLPVRAAFVPWLADVLGLRLGGPAGDVGVPIASTPGAPLALPPGVDALESATGTRRSVAAEGAVAPGERGVWFALRGGRRVGVVVVNASPEESVLARWSTAALASRLAGRAGHASGSPDAWIADTFAAGTRRPAVTPLLVLALLLVCAEAFIVRSSRSTAA